MESEFISYPISNLNSYNVLWRGEIYKGYDESTLLEYIHTNQIDEMAHIQREGESNSIPASEWAKSRNSNFELAIPIQAEIIESNYVAPLDLPKSNIKISRNLITKIWGLPLPLRIVVITAFASFLLFGSAGSGLLLLGTGFGIPVVLIFTILALAIVGAIQVFKSITQNPEQVAYLKLVGNLIAHDAAILRAKHNLREAMKASPQMPQAQPMPEDEKALRAKLLSMNPYKFESHVMSFFKAKGLMAWVTKKSGDAGVDGFARHPNGLIVVQCKRNSPDNLVGRPTVQQFKGVIEENQAYRGYLVTTSSFTREATESGGRNSSLVLVDVEQLVQWHEKGMP